MTRKKTEKQFYDSDELGTVLIGVNRLINHCNFWEPYE